MVEYLLTDSLALNLFILQLLTLNLTNAELIVISFC